MELPYLQIQAETLVYGIKHFVRNMVGTRPTVHKLALVQKKKKKKQTMASIIGFLVKKTNLTLHRMKKGIVYTVKNLGILGTSAKSTLNRKRICQFFLSRPIVMINSLQMRELTTRKMNLPHLQRMMRMI